MPRWRAPGDPKCRRHERLDLESRERSNGFVVISVCTNSIRKQHHTDEMQLQHLCQQLLTSPELLHWSAGRWEASLPTQAHVPLPSERHLWEAFVHNKTKAVYWKSNFKCMRWLWSCQICCGAGRGKQWKVIWPNGDEHKGYTWH